MTKHAKAAHHIHPQGSSPATKRLKSSPSVTAPSTPGRSTRRSTRTQDKKKTASVAVGTPPESVTVAPSSEVGHLQGQLFEDENILKIFFSYVGPEQYLFISRVNRTFHKVYTSLFPTKETRLNASSIDVLQFCWDNIEFLTPNSYIVERKTNLRDELWDCCIQCGKIDVVKYFLEVLLLTPSAQKKECECRFFKASYCRAFYSTRVRNLGKHAAEHGHLALLQWACTQKVGVDKNDAEICIFALGYGHMDVFLWAVRNEFRWDDKCFRRSARLAAENGKVHALKWLQKNDFDLSSCYDELSEMGLCDDAAAYGQVEVLKWLQSIYDSSDDCPWNQHTVVNACFFGHLDAVTFLLDNGGRLNKKLCHFAANSGSVPLLQFLRSRDCEWDEFVPALAAAEGHIDFIEWAVDNGCPLTKASCEYAAAYGELETLKWLHAKGCPWDGMTKCSHAGPDKAGALYDWAVANGYPQVEEKYRVIIEEGILDME